MSEVRFIVSKEEAGLRLDAFLGQKPELGSRSRAAALIKQGAVTVDGEVRPKSHPLAEGEVVTVELSGAPSLQLRAEAVPVPILYEDEWLLVADKPAGMPVHPSPGHYSGTLVHALLGHGLAGGEEFRPGIVHRLDKDTSGLILAAKTAEMHRRLAAMIRDRAVERRYLVLVHGGFAGPGGVIEAPIGRDPVRRKSMTVGGLAAREARTHFRVLERLGDFTLVEARLETGRTHQIRVHFLAIGHPVAGDPVYARRDVLGIGRQFLHSHRLVLSHPVTQAKLDFTSPLPPELTRVLERLRT